MVGTAITPAPVDGMDLPSGQPLTPSFVNSFRIAAVAERLATHVHGTPASQNEAVEFFNLCLALARGIDYAVANSEVPGRAQELPFLLKQVCQRKNDRFLQAAIMVLMISAKNACAMGWFSVHDCKELLYLANEIAQIFGCPIEANTDERASLPTVSKITSRFYPRFKMGQILAFLEAKPGYGTFVIDFNISKMAKSSAEDKIRLFVAQTDNIETASCIVTPPQVNFLLNGKGVEGRTNVSMDTGPQIPTGATHYLKYGTNLLQAVGQFNGNYIIIIAYMSVISNLDHVVLQDYVQPAIATLNSDSDIIEGPSRISLNCPISFRRIKTPVKGHSCKHLQCFDFDNFVDINSRRPSWRCPHCNQSVCYTDIRVDQNVAKVLREVGENVSDVIISADGSWKAVAETNDQTNQVDGPTLQESPSFSGTVPDILDLTEGDDEMDVGTTREAEDRKPILDNFNPTIPTNEVNPNTAPHIEDDFWSGIFFSSFGSGTSNARSDTEIAGGVPEPVPTNFLMSPVLTDAVSPALNREAEAFRGTALLSTSLPQSQVSNNLQLQQSQFGNNLTLSNEYGRVPAISRNVTRTPIAIQALPAPTRTMTSVPQQRSINSLNNLIPNGPSLASQASNGQPSGVDGFNAVSNNMDMQHQFSRPHLNPVQNWDYQNSISSQPGPSAYGVPSTLPTSLQRSHQQPPQNLGMPHPLHQSPSLIQSSALSTPQYPRTRFHPGGTPRGTSPPALANVNAQQARMRNAAQQAAMMAQQSSVPMRTQRSPSSFPVNSNGSTGSVGDQIWRPGGSMQPVMRAENLVDLSSEQNWRPTGRMRGSLSGQAYSDALNQFILQPTQPVQASRPQANLTSPPPGIPFPPELHGLMANSRNAHAPQVVNYPLAQSTGMAGGSSVLPERYLGRN